MAQRRSQANKKKKSKKQRVMSSWTVPRYPWNKQKLQGKSVAMLKWMCIQRGIDVSNSRVFKKGVKPYQTALLNWYDEKVKQDELNNAAPAVDSRMLHFIVIVARASPNNVYK